MNTKHLIFASATATAIIAAGLAWSCVGSEEAEEADLAAEQGFRGFNEPLSGAIFTTLPDGSAVNANIYPSKDDVYLDGGPGPQAPIDAAGLPPGEYYFQVTDPSGKDLLSEDHISCRRVEVNAEGVISKWFDDGRNYEWRQGSWVEAPCQHLTGTDQDHGGEGAITVQLMPYADTPNNGGVYKVWMTPTNQYLGDPNLVPDGRKDGVNGENWEPGNVHGFVPAHAKTDNYKVKGGPPHAVITLTLRKFHDPNLNGVLDEGEQEITGWEVALNDPLGGSNNYHTPASVYVSEGTWAALESTPAGTTITAAYLDGALQSRYPDADPLVLIDVLGDKGETHDLLYGDACVDGTAEACKIYDRDGDGQVDEGEPGVSGWTFQLSGTDITGGVIGPITQTTGAGGCTSFTGLLPGEYTITEQSGGGEWIASGPQSQTFSIASTLEGAAISCNAAATSFTNYCKGSAAFGTKGYWHNKNGLDEIAEVDIQYVNTLSPYSAPSTYFDAGDEPFDGKYEDGSEVNPARGPDNELLSGAGTPRAEISHFLVDANADGDPREQLAQQLLAFIFNTRQRLDGAGASVQMPDGTFMPAGELVAQAIAAWEGEDAAAQVEIKDTLDAFNNSEAVVFIYDTPCDIPQ